MDALRAVYLTNTNGEQSRYHIWDRGQAVGDSITPSTYNGAYRSWMRDLLRKFLDEADGDAPGLLSAGCGNASVEAGLVTAGYRVLGIDAMEEAIPIARAKGVDAVCADVLEWMPPADEDWRVVYADGFLGHVVDPVEGIRPTLERFKSWLPEGRGTLVISNDGPKTESDTQIHTEAPQFIWLSAPYLKAQAEAAGFRDVWTTWFTYERPISGSWERVIVTARS